MARDWETRDADLEYKPVRQTVKGIGYGWVIAIVVVVLCGALSAGIWIFKVGSSDIKGRGDTEIIKNDARNRIRAQEGFLDKYNAIVTADKNLTLTAEQLKGQPDSVKLQTELTGQKMVCNDAVGAYNSAAQKVTQQDFRDADLPDRIDGSTPDTDCKE